MKYAWIDLHRQTFALAEMCALPVVSISSYRAWKHGGKADRQWLTDAQRLALIRAIHVQHKVAYGSPRMVDALRDRGFPASRARVERLMREHGIRARHKRRFKATTDSQHSLPVAANLLNHHFNPGQPAGSLRFSSARKLPDARVKMFLTFYESEVVLVSWTHQIGCLTGAFGNKVEAPTSFQNPHSPRALTLTSAWVSLQFEWGFRQTTTELEIQMLTSQSKRTIATGTILIAFRETLFSK